MWIWRRIEKISWKDHISNKDVLKRVKERRSLIETIVRRKKNWIGHVLRGCGMLKEIIEGRFEGNAAEGEEDWYVRQFAKRRKFRNYEKKNK